MSRNKMFVATLLTVFCIACSGTAFARMNGGGYHSGGGSFSVRQNTMNHTMSRSGYNSTQSQNQNQNRYQHQNSDQNQEQNRAQHRNQEQIRTTSPQDAGQGSQAVNDGDRLQLQDRDRDRIDQPATSPTGSDQ